MTEQGTLDVPQTEFRAAVLSVVLHRDRPHLPGTRHVLSGLQKVRLRRGVEALRLTEEACLHIEIDDAQVSAPHADLRLERRNWLLTDLGSTNGTYVNGDRISPRQDRTLRDGDVIEVGRTFLTIRLDQPYRLVTDPLDLPGDSPPPYAGWQTFHLPLAHLLQDVVRFAPTELNALILGPTGTGKERIAQGIHALSGRKGPLVDLNCAALPESMIDSELFGHRRGAFTGAIADRKGLIEASSGGTLFLDEVADLPAGAQARLLRVLEERTVRRIGDNASYAVDLRIVSATSQDLGSRGFRTDLFQRLAGFTVTLPPIHHRREDLGLIFAENLRGRPLSFDADAARAVLLHVWPGGAREVRQTLDQLVVLASDRPAKRTQLRDLPFGLPVARESTTLGEASDFTRAQIVDALQARQGDVAKAAALLGCARPYLYRLAKKHDLDLASFRKR
jgi:transcriptional regulator of acetoin/glycerol metabolism